MKLSIEVPVKQTYALTGLTHEDLSYLSAALGSVSRVEWASSGCVGWSQEFTKKLTALAGKL